MGRVAFLTLLAIVGGYANYAHAGKGKLVTLRGKRVRVGAVRLEPMGFAFSEEKVSAVDLDVTQGSETVSLTIGVGKSGYALGQRFEIVSAAYVEPHVTKVRVTPAVLRDVPAELATPVKLTPGVAYQIDELSLHFVSDYPNAVVVELGTGQDNEHLDLDPFATVRWKKWTIHRVGEEGRAVVRAVRETFTPVVYEQPNSITVEERARALDGLVITLLRVSGGNRRGAVVSLELGGITQRITLHQGRPKEGVLQNAYRLELLPEHPADDAEGPRRARIVISRVSVEALAYDEVVVLNKGDMRRLPTGEILRYGGSGHKHPARGGAAYGYHELMVVMGERKNVRAPIDDDGVGRWEGSVGRIELRTGEEPGVRLRVSAPTED